MKTISFYAYKGGTGRSLVVANIAKYLALFGQKVFVVDLDLEAPGLHYKLSSTEQPLEISQGIVDFFHLYQDTGELPSSIRNYYLSVPLHERMPGSVQLMPAGKAPSPEYWRKVAGLDWHDFFYRPGAKGVAMFLELKERIRIEVEPDFLLIDARTGITEVGGVATTILPDIVVCLLVNNRENLDGVRVVMRSIQRSARVEAKSPVEIIPVLARIPKDDDPKEEDGLCEFIKAFLNEPAEKLEDTLNVSNIYVLHSDPRLQTRERVLVGSDENRSVSILLQDYLRLFALLIPPDALQPSLGRLLESAKAALFEDPDAAQSEMENLASYFGHPEIYRELLRLYRVRNITGKVPLSTANALWEATHDPTDPILWATIQNSIKSISPWETIPLPVSVMEKIWSRHGANDLKVGQKIAEIYIRNGEGGAAGTVLLKLIAGGDRSDETLAQAVDYLRAAQKWEEATELLKECGGAGPKVIEAWARVLIDQPKLISEISLGEGALAQLTDTSVVSAVRLYRALGNTEKAAELLKDALGQAVSTGSSSRVLQIGRLYDELGLFDDFEDKIRAEWPVQADELLSDVRSHSHSSRIRRRP